MLLNLSRKIDKDFTDKKYEIQSPSLLVCIREGNFLSWSKDLIFFVWNSLKLGFT